MSVLIRCFALVVFALSFADAASAQLLPRRDLSFSMALAIAQGAIAECQKRGFAVSVVVVDRGGDTMVALRDDDASPHTMENARRKAYTARTFRMTTEEFVRALESNPVRRAQTTLPNVIANPGGVPIKVNNDTIGGVGVSGSPGQDESCVMAGIDKVREYLRRGRDRGDRD